MGVIKVPTTRVTKILVMIVTKVLMMRVIKIPTSPQLITSIRAFLFQVFGWVITSDPHTVCTKINHDIYCLYKLSSKPTGSALKLSNARIPIIVGQNYK